MLICDLNPEAGYLLECPGRLSEAERRSLERQWGEFWSRTGQRAPCMLVLEEGRRLREMPGYERTWNTYDAEHCAA